eukprot:3694416-Pyramimonas_sp.AAC.1
MAQDDFHDASKMPSRKPRWPNMVPKMVPRRLQSGQNGPTTVQHVIQTAQATKTAQEGPKRTSRRQTPLLFRNPLLVGFSF